MKIRVFISFFGKTKLLMSGLINVIRDYILYLFSFNKKQIFVSIEKNILVIGNGPSLKGILENKAIKFSDFELFVCNGFSTTEYYEKLKPKFYFLKDNLYFDLENTFVIEKKNNVLDTWDSIFSKTKWNITIYTALYDISVIDILKNRYSKNIHIKWKNIYPIEFRGINKYKFLNKGIGLIGGMTVTHFSLFVAILKAKKQIYISGVDHDWISNICYDENNHKLYLNDNHFYNSEKIYYEEGIFFRHDIVSELFAQFKSFEGFKSLLNFAIYKKVEIYRCTKSFLHFFKYKNINND